MSRFMIILTLILILLSYFGLTNLIDWRKILFQSNHPSIPNLRGSNDDSLRFDSLTRGTLIAGKAGSGKTRYSVKQTLDYALKYPDRAIFSLDASGSFTDDFLEAVWRLPRADREKLAGRIVLDILGDDEYVVPFPFFSISFITMFLSFFFNIYSYFIIFSLSLISSTPLLFSSLFFINRFPPFTSPSRLTSLSRF